MSSSNFKVRPLSWDKIAQYTDGIRSKFSLSDRPDFPIMQFVETVLDYKLSLVRFEVGSHAEMDGAEGLTCPKGTFIQFREDVYEAAWKDDGRARFTAAHELGHFVLHTNMPLARVKPGENVKPYRLSEQQANQFAAEILMPPRFFSVNDTEFEVVTRHGVSWEAASNRLDYLRKRGKLK